MQERLLVFNFHETWYNLQSTDYFFFTKKTLPISTQNCKTPMSLCNYKDSEFVLIHYTYKEFWNIETNSSPPALYEKLIVWEKQPCFVTECQNGIDWWDVQALKACALENFPKTYLLIGIKKRLQIYALGNKKGRQISLVYILNRGEKGGKCFVYSA